MVYTQCKNSLSYEDRIKRQSGMSNNLENTQNQPVLPQPNRLYSVNVKPLTLCITIQEPRLAHWGINDPPF